MVWIGDTGLALQTKTPDPFKRPIVSDGSNPNDVYTILIDFFKSAQLANGKSLWEQILEEAGPPPTPPVPPPPPPPPKPMPPNWLNEVGPDGMTVGGTIIFPMP